MPHPTAFTLGFQSSPVRNARHENRSSSSPASSLLNRLSLSYHQPSFRKAGLFAPKFDAFDSAAQDSLSISLYLIDRFSKWASASLSLHRLANENVLQLSAKRCQAASVSASLSSVCQLLPVPRMQHPPFHCETPRKWLNALVSDFTALWITSSEQFPPARNIKMLLTDWHHPPHPYSFLPWHGPVTTPSASIPELFRRHDLLWYYLI